MCAAGLAVRVAYVLVIGRRGLVGGGDAYQYHQGANLLVDGRGFIGAYPGFGGRQVAQHPPLYTVVLAVASVLGMRSFLSHQLWSCLLGTGAVAVLGLAGRRLAGPGAGLVAAGIGAAYPNAWVLDGLVAAETLSLLLAGLTVLAALRLWQGPSTGAALALGTVCGLAALTRAEGILFLPLVAAPFVLAARGPERRFRLRLAGAAVAATIAVLSPWMVFNLRRFEHPTVGTSTGLDLALVQSNCDASYFGRFIGYYSFSCIPALPGPGDETTDDIVYRRQAVEYVRGHWARLPFVVFARLGRTWGFYHPLEQLEIERFVQGRDLGVARAGLAAYYLLAGGAVTGLVALRRRQVRVSPLVALAVTVSVAAALTSGETRYRASAEPTLVLLAAVAVDDRRRRHLLRPADGRAAG